MTSTSLIFRLLLALTLTGLLSCKQGEGETCIQDDNCSGSLVCCKPGTTATSRGTCLPVGEACVDPDPDPIDLGPIELDLGIDLGTGDMGTDTDMGQDDGGLEEDMGPGDLGTDGGPEDMGEPDLGDTEDMG